MSRRGEGIYKRKDGRWEARYIHHYENGKAKYRYLYADSYGEVKAKRQREMVKEAFGKNTGAVRGGDFRTLAVEWLMETKKRAAASQIKESTYTRYHRLVHVYLLPLFRYICIHMRISFLSSGMAVSICVFNVVNTACSSSETLIFKW